MNANRYTVDSNIFIYALDARDPAKHRVALQILSTMLRSAAPLPLQCLQESFAVCAKKKIAALPLVHNAVNDALRSLRIYPAEPQDLQEAIASYERHNIQFFDALLLATATRSGCTTLFSEDFQHHRTYGPLTVINPFLLSPADLSTLLA